MQEQKNNGEYLIVIRNSNGRYISIDYKNEKYFQNSLLDIKGLIIAIGISGDDAEKKCRDFNDSHFPLPGLENFVI